jgi:hypothetical protein
MRADRGHHQRVTVGRRFGGYFRRNVTAGAAAVIDDERLPEALAHLRFDRARDDVGGAPDREGDQHADGPVRILLRENRRGSQQ